MAFLSPPVGGGLVSLGTGARIQQKALGSQESGVRSQYGFDPRALAIAARRFAAEVFILTSDS
jgi:hypothetical protein